MPQVELTDAYGVVYVITSRNPDLIGQWLAELLPTSNPDGAYISKLRVVPLYGEGWPGSTAADAATLDGLITALQKIQSDATERPPPDAQM
jgi:hypothetical protein